MAQPVMWTYEDAIDRMLDAFDLRKKTARDLRQARKAVLDAYNALPTEKIDGWLYYRTAYSFHTEAEYNTGTIAYTASTRVVALTTGTWPANAAFGILSIDGQRYDVESRTDDNNIVLSAAGAPPADIAAGTSYNWYRESYPVPCEWRASSKLVDSDANRYIKHISPHEILMQNRAYDGTIDRSQFYTVQNDSNYFNGLALVLGPPPNSVRKYDMSMKAEGRALNVRGDALTVTVPSAGTTVTAVTGTFDVDNHYGSVIRFSSDGDTTAPTSKTGYIAGDNPYTYQRRLKSITSTTEAELDVAIPAPGLTSTTAASVSDPIDIENGAMLNCFWALCEYYMAREVRNKDVGKYSRLYYEELERASQADQRDESIQTGYMTGSNDRYGLPLGDIDLSY